MHDGKSNQKILEEFDTLVKGHHQAKKALINLFNRSKIRYYQKYKHLEKDYNLLEPSKILLVGPSGNGKTYLVETACRLMNAPLIKVDATEMTPSGRSDGINAERLKELIRTTAASLVNTNKNYHSVDGTICQTIVFVDEIDKLAKSFDSTGNWNKHVQESFLTLFDNRDEFAGVSFIFAGAFTGLDAQHKSCASIGFNSNVESPEKSVELDQEIIKFGLIPELVGRINGIYKIDTLTKHDYTSILNEILIPKKQDELVYFNHMGFGLKQDEIDEIVAKAMASGQGVRSLNRELDKLMIDLEFYYEDVQTDTLLLEHMIDRYSCQNKLGD